MLIYTRRRTVSSYIIVLYSIEYLTRFRSILCGLSCAYLIQRGNQIKFLSQLLCCALPFSLFLSRSLTQSLKHTNNKHKQRIYEQNAAEGLSLWDIEGNKPSISCLCLLNVSSTDFGAQCCANDVKCLFCFWALTASDKHISMCMMVCMACMLVCLWLLRGRGYYISFCHLLICWMYVWSHTCTKINGLTKEFPKVLQLRNTKENLEE